MSSIFLQFNFVGKLLGPQGNSLKRLQAETGTKMSILGKGSMREKKKVRFKLILQHAHTSPVQRMFENVEF